ARRCCSPRSSCCCSAASARSATSCSCSDRGGFARQRELKIRAGPGRGIDPDPAAVASDDPLDRGEADAGAGKLLVAVEALERTEQAVGVLHVEAGAVVADEVDRPFGV